MLYPLAVIIFSLTVLVAELPMTIVVTMSISSFSRFFSVVIFAVCPSRPACLTIPMGVSGFMYFIMISYALVRGSMRSWLLGLYSTMDMSAWEANSSLFSIFSSGVKRSLRLITAKSLINGAPRSAEAAEAAVIPGRISIGMPVFSCAAISNTMPAMP